MSALVPFVSVKQDRFHSLTNTYPVRLPLRLQQRNVSHQRISPGSSTGTQELYIPWKKAIFIFSNRTLANYHKLGYSEGFLFHIIWSRPTGDWILESVCLFLRDPSKGTRACTGIPSGKPFVQNQQPLRWPLPTCTPGVDVPRWSHHRSGRDGSAGSSLKGKKTQRISGSQHWTDSSG